MALTSCCIPALFAPYENQLQFEKEEPSRQHCQNEAVAEMAFA
jgi:hypothetical protein